MALYGRLVVVLASCGGDGGGEAGGGSGWWLEQRRKRRREKTTETRQKGWFLADFGPDFLLSQAIKPASIYRRWKRAILSTLGEIFSF